jgi:hypothetical protein
MPIPPKLNEIPVYLKDEGRGKVSFVFEDDRSEDFPYDVTLYLKNNDNDTEIAIGTATTLSENVFYFEDEDDNDNTGNYLYDADRHPIGFVKNLTNSFYIKQSELVGGAQPPSLHPGQVHIDNLVVGNEYEFVIDNPWFVNETEQRTYRGTLMPLTYQNLEDPPLRISNYTINGVRQEGFITFPLSSIRAIRTEPSAQQPSGGGKKKKAKKTKKAKKKKAKKTKKAKKSKKAKKTQRKSIRRRR